MAFSAIPEGFTLTHPEDDIRACKRAIRQCSTFGFRAPRLGKGGILLSGASELALAAGTNPKPGYRGQAPGAHMRTVKRAR